MADARTKMFYYTLVKVSRIINKRNEINEEDYYLLKWILEKTNCRLDINSTVNYDISGNPDIVTQKKLVEQIDDNTKDTKDVFGISQSELELFDGH